MITDAHKAYRLIKEKIITLQLAPGSVIQDLALAAELGLGRTPIREALKLLEAEELIFTVPRRGIFVSHVSITDLQQLCEIRVELEGLSARLAAQRATEEELGRLEKYAHENWPAQVATLVQRITEDRQFHAEVAAIAHNHFLESEIERFFDLSLRLWHLALANVRADAVDASSHGAIVGAIMARDAQRAETLMGEHIHVFQNRIKAAM